MNMPRRYRCVLAVALACAGVQASHAAEPSVQSGRAVFELRCAACHGTARGGDPSREHLPGTDALRIKYQGRVPALLEQRADLNEAVLRVYIRRGSWSMPPFRKTEVSDQDIADLAAYLAASASSSRAARDSR